MCTKISECTVYFCTHNPDGSMSVLSFIIILNKSYFSQTYILFYVSPIYLCALKPQ